MNVWQAITEEDSVLVAEAEVVGGRDAERFLEAWEELGDAIARFEAMKFAFKMEHGTPEERQDAEDELGPILLRAAQLKAVQQKARSQAPPGTWDPDTTN